MKKKWTTITSLSPLEEPKQQTKSQMGEVSAVTRHKLHQEKMRQQEEDKQRRRDEHKRAKFMRKPIPISLV